MRKSKFTEEQIAFALKQAEHGTPITEVTRKMGITEETYYRWKKKYGGLGTAELRCLRQLEEENRKLKQVFAELSLENTMLKDFIEKNTMLASLDRMPGWEWTSTNAAITSAFA